VLCFFFQAEDGIRDDLVTGVQTCALPILDHVYRARRDASRRDIRSDEADIRAEPRVHRAVCGFGVPGLLASLAKGHERVDVDDRSEERRVGKECECGWWRAMSRDEGEVVM